MPDWRDGLDPRHEANARVIRVPITSRPSGDHLATGQQEGGDKTPAKGDRAAPNPALTASRRLGRFVGTCERRALLVPFFLRRASLMNILAGH